jgi:Cu/Ag efflux protein CusF
MKKLMLAAGAAALLAASSLAAFAADVTGSITAVDATAMTVTLDDGKIYALPQDFDVATLKQGEKVLISYEEQDGKLVITRVEPSQS